ncbi:MAG: SH3 domain-containing protein [Oscillospiraceae bacterium]|nr:SH3 domain-containing protein [Oscillospiraceae bacterium]
MRKHIIRTFTSVVLVVVLLLSVASISASAESTAYINTDGTIARSGPGTNYSVVAILNSGTKVTIVQTNENGWFKVLIGGNYAYIHCWNMTLEPYTITPASFAAYINRDGVAMRVAPNEAYAVLTTLNKGQVVLVVEEHSSGWCGVLLNGVPGYVYGSYVTPGYFVPPTITDVNYTAYVNTNGTNVRVAPNEAFASMASLPYGFEVTVIQEMSNGWCGVVSNGIPGFIYGSYLSKGPYMNSYDITITNTSYTGFINQDGTNIRVAPSTDYPSLLLLPRGFPVQVVGETSSGWCAVSLNGGLGWVYGAFVSTGTYTPEEIGIGIPLTKTAVNFTGVINQDRVDIRNYPSSVSASIGQVNAGTPVLVLEQYSNNWYGVVVNGYPGFVYSGYVS